MASRMAPTVRGRIKDGMPPPRKIEETSRPPVRAAVVSISRANARAKRSSSTGACRTWLLKSQYGHFDRQNGQCTYTPNASETSAPFKTNLREFHEGAGTVRQPEPERRQAM